MIAFLCGRLAAKHTDVVYIDVQGVGYRLFMSARSISRLPDIGEEVQLLTHVQLRDDAVILYGFLSQTERELFEKLLTVSGVGPKVALSALSCYDPAEVIAAITAQDVAFVQRVPGIGKKMASRIVLELKESLGQADSSFPAMRAQAPLEARAGAAEALLSMGFSSEEVRLALQGAAEQASEAEVLQYALKRLGA